MSRFLLNRVQWLAIVQAIILLILAGGIIQPLSIHFATEAASNPVSDIILSNIPVFDVDGLFVYGLLLFLGYIMFLCIRYPRRIPFMLNALSLFVIIRSVFVILTHVGPFLPHVQSDFSPTLTRLFFGSDLFFSGHTGAPFLFALMYWHERVKRWVFLVWSGAFAVIVLLGHLHYSIDVAAAYFITYSIYHLALHFFPRSRAWFVEDDHVERKAV